MQNNTTTTPGNMSSDAATQAAEQSEIPTSVYSTLKTSDAAGNYQTATCTIARGDMIAWDTSYQCYIQSGISNGCTVLENNPNCQLQSETIDGVVTVNNYVATGLEPLSSCQVMSNTLSVGCNYVCPGDGNWSVPCLDSPVCVVESQMAALFSGVCPLGQGIPCSSAPTGTLLRPGPALSGAKPNPGGGGRLEQRYLRRGERERAPLLYDHMGMGRGDTTSTRSRRRQVT